MRKYKGNYAIINTNNGRIEGFYKAKPEQAYINDLNRENHAYFELYKGIHNIYLASKGWTEKEIKKQFV